MVWEAAMPSTSHALNRRLLGVGLYKRFVCIFRDWAIANSTIGTKHLHDFAPLYFAHKQYRAMYGSLRTPFYVPNTMHHWLWQYRVKAKSGALRITTYIYTHIYAYLYIAAWEAAMPAVSLVLNRRLLGALGLTIYICMCIGM